jgi:Glycosyl hydrolase family 99
MLANARSGVCVVVLVTAAALTLTTTVRAGAAYSEEHPVLAYYYGMASHDVRGQVAQAQAAGIDGFIVWWDGVGGDRDQQFVQVLEAGRASGFRATIHFHALGGSLVQELRGFYDTRINDPGLVTYQGRPVLFFWATWLQSPQAWSDLRNQVDPDRRAIWLADGDKFNILGEDAWDGISPYAIAWSANPRGQLPAWAAKARGVAPSKLWVPPVSPGCDDSRVRAVTCIQDRAGGEYYRATWDGALASRPSWAIVVSTWDEWMEQTQIEPGAGYGDLYLQITRTYAFDYKGAAPMDVEPPAAPAEDASGA